MFGRGRVAFRGVASDEASLVGGRVAATVAALVVFLVLGGTSCSKGPRYQRTLPGDASGPVDTPVGPNDDGLVPADSGSGGSTVMPGLPAGQPCTAPGNCQTGFCSDGVCCATDCSNPCHSCASQGSVGTCLPAEVGTDPRNECTDEGLASCGGDGTCDGAGTCRKYAAGVICKQPSCSGSTLTPAFRCSGAGACVTAPGQPCDPYACGADGTCATSCTTTAQCVAPNSCNAGSCGKRPLGGSCAGADDCNSGICAQGVCCQTACAESCKSCAIPGSAGACIAVPAGEDPLGQCADQGAAMCATDGSCDGNGKCRTYASGTVCAPATCAGSTATLASRCNGLSTCMAGATLPCTPYVCGANGQCRSTCTVPADCAPGNVCSGAMCGKRPVGSTCAVAGDCVSGICAQGVCCQSSCSDACLSCALPGAMGVCSPIAAGQDPMNQCPDQGAMTCGTDGMCNGAGRCRTYAAGVPCGMQTCTGSTETLESRCDGAGTCAPGATQSCAPYTCGTGATCRSTCSIATDCTTGNVCTAGSCGKKPPGATCTAGADCVSGFCAQGVCCQTDCTGLCRSCALTGSAGMCSPVPAGQDPLDQCADAGAMTCGDNGLCDGNGVCQRHASGTQCAAAACTGSTLSSPRTCNGTGTCQMPTTSSCGNYNCGPSGQCLTMCMTNADCVSPNVCNSGVCSKKTPGTTCATGTECASGICQQNVCCLSSCTGTCQSCALAGSAGTCTMVPAGMDPLNQCTDAGASSCALDGMCNGMGGCRQYATGTVCMPASCVGSTFTPMRTCNGTGTCSTAATSMCNPYQCNTTINMCRTTCGTTADCVSPNMCMGTSCGKLADGATCTLAAECNSGFCANSVCCNAACTGTCQACNLAGTVGTCTAVPAGQDPMNQCAAQAATTCGTDGSCNGSGACRLFASGTTCRASTGVCDVTETCNGTVASCPADSGSSPPPVPTGLVATAGNGQVNLTWTASAGATGYVVKRGTANGGPYTNVATPAANSFLDTGLANGTTYYYVVSATSLSGACQSANSTQASATPSACAGGVYCDTFETYTVGVVAPGWTRNGGSMGDWLVQTGTGTNTTKVFQQANQLSSTNRFIFASSGGSPAPPWGGATSVSADVKVLAASGTGTPTARLCLRYTSLTDWYCLGMLTSGAIRIETNVGGTFSTSASWATPVAVGTWYNVRLAVSAGGVLSAYKGATLLGTYTPGSTLANGYAGFGTESTTAAFDNIVVTQP